MRTRTSLCITAVLLLFFFTRLLLVFFSSHVYLADELKQVPLGMELARGKLTLPFWCYQYSPHAGGSIFAGLSLVPFICIFGEKYLAVKITALCYSLLTLYVIFSILKKYYPCKHIVPPLVIFFVFSAPHYLQKSLSLLGNVVELIVIAFLFLWLIERVVIAGRERRLYYLILGIVAGFGAWVQYIFVAFILAFLIFWVVRRGASIFRCAFWFFLAGCLLGFLPWIVYNCSYEFASINFDMHFSSCFLSGEALGAGARGLPWPFCLMSVRQFMDVLSIDLPRSFHFLSLQGIPAQLIAYFLYGIFWVSCFCLLFKAEDTGKKELHLLSVLFFCVPVCFFLLRPIPIGSLFSSWGSLNYNHEYYLAFLHPIMFTILAMAYAECSRRKVFIFLKVLFYIFLPITFLQFFKLLDGSSCANYSFAHLKAETQAFVSGAFFSPSQRLWQKVLSEIENDDLRSRYLKGVAYSYFLNYKTFTAEDLNSSALSNEERKLVSEHLKEYYVSVKVRPSWAGDVIKK